MKFQLVFFNNAKWNWIKCNLSETGFTKLLSEGNHQVIPKFSSTPNTAWLIPLREFIWLIKLTFAHHHRSLTQAIDQMDTHSLPFFFFPIVVFTSRSDQPFRNPVWFVLPSTQSSKLHIVILPWYLYIPFAIIPFLINAKHISLMVCRGFGWNKILKNISKWHSR